MKRGTFLAGVSMVGALALPRTAFALSMEQMRERVAQHAAFLDRVSREDILDPKRSADNLIRAVDVIMERWRILILQTYSNHHDDSILGRYGFHAGNLPGYALSFVPQNDHYLADGLQTRRLIEDAIGDRYVFQVGAPARFANDPQLQERAAKRRVTLFTDEGTGPHITIASNDRL